ncbi:YhfC family glutamic-type intramembrane protease [Amphibacillus sp. Q70]|uniref:YhfC family glutamic-type intramembrane protease n=1 Tax=Amphibacillus sp. Q70 TaxID=3453416 RepID=UPI003F85D915
MFFPMAVAMLIGVGLPIGLFIYCLFRRQYLIPYLLGIITFLISQIMIRIPLLSLFNQSSVGLDLQLFYPVIYALILGISASLFEEYGRWLMMKLPLKNRLSWQAGFWFGLGHGLLEAFLIFGLPILTTIGQVDNLNLWLGSFERFFAILLHISLSILVMYSVATKKYRYFIIALLAHALVDIAVGIFPMIFSQPILFIEGFLLIISLLLFLLSLKLKKTWEGIQ